MKTNRHHFAFTAVNALLALSLAGCATITSSRSQKIHVASTPTRA